MFSGDQPEMRTIDSYNNNTLVAGDNSYTDLVPGMQHSLDGNQYANDGKNFRINT